MELFDCISSTSSAEARLLSDSEEVLTKLGVWEALNLTEEETGATEESTRMTDSAEVRAKGVHGREVRTRLSFSCFFTSSRPIAFIRLELDMKEC